MDGDRNRVTNSLDQSWWRQLIVFPSNFATETAPAGQTAGGPAQTRPESAPNGKCPYINDSLLQPYITPLAHHHRPPPPHTGPQCQFLQREQQPAPLLTLMHLFYLLKLRDRYFKAVRAQRQRQQQQAAEGQGGTAGGPELMATPPPLTNEHIITAWADLNDLFFVFEVCARVIETPAMRDVTRLALSLSIEL